MSHPPDPPPGYGYGAGQPYGPHPVPTNGKATASLVTGITSLVLSLCPLVGFGGIVAIALGIRARKEVHDAAGTQQGEGLALGGIITGAIAVTAGVLVLVLIIAALVHGAAVGGG